MDFSICYKSDDSGILEFDLVNTLSTNSPSLNLLQIELNGEIIPVDDARLSITETHYTFHGLEPGNYTLKATIQDCQVSKNFVY